MSFIGSSNGKTYAPGYFLASEECERETRKMTTSLAVASGTTRYVPMGTIYPENGANAEGIVYEDVDVTTGDMPGSVVTKGTVYTSLLPTAPNASAKTALASVGIKLITFPSVTRPY